MEILAYLANGEKRLMSAKDENKQDKKDDYDVYSLLGKKFPCPYCKREHYLPIEMIENKKGAISMLPSLTEKVSKGKSILLLSDNITYAVAGEKVQTIFKDAGWQVEGIVLQPEGVKTVHAEDRYLPRILSAGKGKDIIFTIGAGSITDLGKYTGYKLDIPVVSFPTAPSMNAYTSGVAALIKSGLKVTLPVPPPKAVIIDTDIIFSAPLELMQAGFADSMAKCYANADWRLTSIIADGNFCPLPLKIVTVSEKRYLGKGKRLVQREESVISDLMDGLLRGGFAMVIAGTSSPASGGEHLLSHYLDMEACNREEEPFSYHGLQVGIGVVIVSKIYERLGTLNVTEVEKRLARHDEDDYREKISKAFPERFPTIWREFAKKIPVLKGLSTSLVRNWNEIKDKVLPMVFSQETVEGYLQDAGCPVHFSEIGVDDELTYRTIMNARYIRNKLTVLDIADELGVLEEIAGEFVKKGRAE